MRKKSATYFRRERDVSANTARAEKKEEKNNGKVIRKKKIVVDDHVYVAVIVRGT